MLGVSDSSTAVLLLSAAVTGIVGAVATALIPSLRRLAVALVRRGVERCWRLARRGRSRRLSRASTTLLSEGPDNAGHSTSHLSDEPSHVGAPHEQRTHGLHESPASTPSPSVGVITVQCNGSPLVGAEVLALFPNDTWVAEITDSAGEANLGLYNTGLPMTVFAAAQGCTAHVTSRWTPTDGGLAVDLSQLPDGGSMVIRQGTGHIPGLAGRLNPILDTLGRTYLYADNIAVNGGQPKPVTFVPGRDRLSLVDANGNEFRMCVTAIKGRSALIEYQRAAPAASN